MSYYISKILFLYIYGTVFAGDDCNRTIFLTSNKTAKWYNQTSNTDNPRDTNELMGEYWHWYRDTRPDYHPAHVYYRVTDDDENLFLYRMRWGLPKEKGRWAVNNILLFLHKPTTYNFIEFAYMGFGEYYTYFI